MSTVKTRRPPHQAAFLAALSISGQVKQAAQDAGVSRDQHYAWLKSDSGYQTLVKEAKERAYQAWEDEAIERANRGVFEPFSYKGAYVFPVVGYKKNKRTGKPDKRAPIFGKLPYGVWKKSDRLLEFLLRGAKPEVYRERTSVEVAGAGGGPIEIVERLIAARKRLAKGNDGSQDEKTE